MTKHPPKPDLWLLIGHKGEREQVCTRPGGNPSAEGSNPNGWREVRVDSHVDLRTPTDIADHRRRAAEAWLAAIPPGALELLADAVAAKLKEGK